MKEHMCYVGRKPCGCIITVIGNTPDRKKHIARTVAGWINEGLIIGRASIEEVQEQFQGCTCDDNQRSLFEKKRLKAQE